MNIKSVMLAFVFGFGLIGFQPKAQAKYGEFFAPLGLASGMVGTALGGMALLMIVFKHSVMTSSDHGIKDPTKRKEEVAKLRPRVLSCRYWYSIKSWISRNKF
jgi:hypothetical protein